MTDKTTELTKILDDLYVPKDFEKYHAYFADPEGTKAYHGVTSILSVIAKPALIGWAANMAVDYIEGKLTWNPIRQGEGVTDFCLIKKEEWPEISKEARTAHTRKNEEAGVKGTDVHLWVSQWVLAEIKRGLA